MDIDAKIKELLAVVADKKQKIEEKRALERTKWLTNCSYEFGDGRANRNIQTANKNQLIEVAMHIGSKRAQLETACKLLGIETPTESAGFSVDSWVTDCKKRLAIIEVNEEQRSLDALEEKLNSLVSPEQRRAMELEMIMKQLGT